MTESPYVKRATLAVATDTSMALQLRKSGSRTQAAAIELIEPAITAHPDVTQAATTAATQAVGQVVSDLDIVQGAVMPGAGIGVSIPFEDGSRNALEVDERGRPTPLSASLHVEVEKGLMGTAIGVETRTDIALEGVAAIFAFEDDSMAGYIYTDGTMSFSRTGAGQVWPAVAAGDSTTAGADLADPTNSRWTTLLANLTGKTITNRGLSGSRAEEIAARLAGLTISGTVSGGSIPASGPVVITNLTVDPWRAGAAPGYLVDALTDTGQVVRGTLDVSGSDRRFTRTTSGSAIATTTLDFRAVAADSGSLLFLGAGINNEPLIDAGTQNLADVTGWYRAATSAWTGPLVIWGVLDRGYSERPGTPRGDFIAALEDWLASTYGTAFAPVRQYLASTRALTDAVRFNSSFAPTTDDTTAVNVGTVPPSFRAVNGTSVHLNELGHQLMARFLHRHLIMRQLVLAA